MARRLFMLCIMKTRLITKSLKIPSHLAHSITKALQLKDLAMPGKGTYGSSLDLPFDFVYFKKLNAIVRRQDFAKGETEEYNVTCSDRTIVENILDSLNTGKSYEKICGGYSWRLFSCSGNRMLCIGPHCKENCGATEAYFSSGKV